MWVAIQKVWRQVSQLPHNAGVSPIVLVKSLSINMSINPIPFEQTLLGNPVQHVRVKLSTMWERDYKEFTTAFQKITIHKLSKLKLD